MLSVRPSNDAFGLAQGHARIRAEIVGTKPLFALQVVLRDGAEHGGIVSAKARRGKDGTQALVMGPRSGHRTKTRVARNAARKHHCLEPMTVRGCQRLEDCLLYTSDAADE